MKLPVAGNIQYNYWTQPKVSPLLSYLFTPYGVDLPLSAFASSSFFFSFFSCCLSLFSFPVVLAIFYHSLLCATGESLLHRGRSIHSHFSAILSLRKLATLIVFIPCSRSLLD